MNRPVHQALLLAATTLIILSLACSLPFSEPAELPDDGPPVPVSKQSAASFVAKVIASTQQATETQTVRFTVSEEEVTSALSYAAELAAFSQGGPLFEGLEQFDTSQLDDQELPPEIEQLRDLGETLRGITGEGRSQGDGGLLDIRLRLEEPQIYFLGDGSMILRGYGRFSRWRLPMRVVVSPSIQEGQIELDFIEGQLGSLPLPEFLFDPLGGLISQALMAGQDYARITELTVSEGTMTFAGEVSLDSLPGN